MDRVRINNITFVKKLRDFHKSYFNVADFEKILNQDRNSLYVTLNRLVKSGVLLRLGKNIYSLFTESSDIEKIAGELYFPSYLSFEKALSYYGILSQIPYTLTFATTRSSKKMNIAGTLVEYSHIKGELFFGYRLLNGKYIAEREKALLDLLYMVSLGKRAINIEELDLSELDKKRFKEYAKRFPARIAPLTGEVIKYIGTTPIILRSGSKTHRLDYDLYSKEQEDLKILPRVNKALKKARATLG